jgi:DNA-directed RNA polymerase specialized sigma24 family protein
MHIKKDYSKDLHLAKKICKELLAKNKDAINELHHHYKQKFIEFALRRIYNNTEVNHIETVLNNFWTELSNAKAICSYKARASLKTYLLNILRKRIIDDNRAFNRQRSTETSNEEDQKYILEKKDDRLSQEDELIQRERLRLLQEAILMLENNSPKDADVIRMYLDGLNYGEMAEKKLKDQKEDQKKLIKLTNAIKKQFTRKRTGTMVKFKICLNRCLERHGLDYTDIMN